MSERYQRRQVTVGAEVSPLDPDGHPRRPHPAPAVDVVQAVADLVDDLVDEPGDADDTGDAHADDTGDAHAGGRDAVDDGPGCGPRRS